MRLAPLAALLIVVSAFSQTTGKRADLDGVWILLRAQVGTLRLTPEGEKKRAAYDFQKDDPDFQCRPASFTRVMHTPSPPIEVLQRQDHVEVNYEFMDIHRRVPVKQGLVAKDAPYAAREYPHLGRSVGQYEGETLVVETVGQARRSSGYARSSGTLSIRSDPHDRTIHTRRRQDADHRDALRSGVF